MSEALGSIVRVFVAESYDLTAVTAAPWPPKLSRAKGVFEGFVTELAPVVPPVVDMSCENTSLMEAAVGNDCAPVCGLLDVTKDGVVLVPPVLPVVNKTVY